jgi:hypothetical protein
MERFDVEHVDSITEAGPNRVLSEQKNDATVQSILGRVNISVEKHHSVGIAVVGHHDCAGNPAPKANQIADIRDAIRFLRQQFENMEVIGLWVDEDWEVHEIAAGKAGELNH